MGLSLHPAHKARNYQTHPWFNRPRSCILAVPHASRPVQPVRRVSVTATAVQSAELTRLQAAVQKVFPITEEDPKATVRRQLANYLLEQQGHKTRLAHAAAVTLWHSKSHSCRPRSFKKFINNTIGFVVEGTNGMDTVELDARLLLDSSAAAVQMAQEARDATSTSSSKSSAGGSSVSAVSADREQLRQLVADLWPKARCRSDPAVRVKRFMADLLLAEPDLTLPQGAIGKVGQELGKAKKLGFTGGFEKLLSKDPSGCFCLDYEGTPPSICLDAAALRQYARQQQGMAGSSDGDGGSSSDGDGGSSSNVDGSSSGDEEGMLQVCIVPSMSAPNKHLLALMAAAAIAQLHVWGKWLQCRSESSILVHTVRICHAQHGMPAARRSIGTWFYVLIYCKPCFRCPAGSTLVAGSPQLPFASRCNARALQKFTAMLFCLLSAWLRSSRHRSCQSL